MKLTDVKGDQVINCKTLGENIRICRMLDEQGFKMISNGSYKSDRRWRDHKGLTCYDINSGKFGTVNFYLDCGYTVINSTKITGEPSQIETLVAETLPVTAAQVNTQHAETLPVTAAQVNTQHAETLPAAPDPVNHPTHYGGQDDPYEVIKVINAWGLGFELGNTVKYIARAGKKDPSKRLEDLKKAAWYLAHEIAKY